RLKPWDFKTVTEVTKRYGKSYIPQGSTVEDWPITYDDLEPYYDIAEREVGVSGKAGNIKGRIDKEGNIFEGPRQREYPMPHLRSCDYLDHMKKAARELGWTPFHGAAAPADTMATARPGDAIYRPRTRLAFPPSRRRSEQRT